MESKGLITPQEWREFCSETVPLLRMKKYTWTADETFLGRIEVAHYGLSSLENARIVWAVEDGTGEILTSQALPPLFIEQGRVSEADMISFPLGEVKTPQKLTVMVSIQDTSFVNRYPVWIYPPEVDTSVPQEQK